MELAICIPTYNRGPQLRELLESIVRQTGHGLTVLVVISDNASTDDTPVVVAAFRDRGLRILYDRSPENLGFDRNMLRVVAMATAEYCWLFGSDDVLEEGALARVEQVLRGCTPTGVSVGAHGYAPDLSRRIAHKDRISSDFTRETTLRGREAIVKAVGPWGLGYISSIIVRRQAWADVAATSPVDDYLNGYVHIYVLARALDERSTWVCVPERLVGWRSGNDSATSVADEFKRTRLDLMGFEESFGGALGRRSAAYRETMRKVATFYIRSHFLTAKSNGVSARYWRQAIPMSLARYWRYPSFWTRTLPIALMPKAALSLARQVRRRGWVGRPLEKDVCGT